MRSAAGLATTIVRALDEAAITVYHVEVHQPSLDDVFFTLTGHAAAEASAAEASTEASAAEGNAAEASAAEGSVAA